MSPDVIQAALGYAQRGWLVFPVGINKAPVTPHGFHDATGHPEETCELFEAHQGTGVAIRTGVESGLVVLDVDPDKGGDESLFDLEQTHGPLPETIESLTGGGGRHVFFSHPGGEIRCSVGALGPGLDLRADGGYVVAPPSPHSSGRRYEWEVCHDPNEVALSAMPEWLLAATAGPQARRGASADPVADQIFEGARNSTLASLAGSMRRRGMGPREIEAAISVTNEARCRPPLPAGEVERIAASVARYEPSAPPIASEEPAHTQELEVLTAREIFELPDQSASSELVGPLLVRGARTVIGAHTGEGKTTFALQLAQAVAMKDTFLEWRGAGCRVLIIDAEQGLRTIKRRLKEAGLAHTDRIDYLRAPDGLALDVDGPDVAQLEAVFEKGEYGLVVADPLYKLHRGDSNEERAAVDLMRRLDAWRTRFEFSLLMLVHRRKVQMGGRKFSMDDLFGSSAYLRGAEVVLGLRRPAPGIAKLSFFKDRDGDLPTGEIWTLIFDRDEGGFRRDPDDGEPKETAREKISKALEAEPGQTLDQLQRVAGCSDRTARKAVKDLGAEYETRAHGAKLWRLPSDGEEVES